MEISFSPLENCLSIFESVNDQVTVSKYPFDAKDLWDKWNNFCLKFKVSLSRFLSGSTNLIFSKPLILINSSIKSTSWLISGLQEGISTFKSFLPFLHWNPKDKNIFCASLIVIGIPIKFSNLLVSNLMMLFFWVFFPVIINLLTWPPQILMINSAAISNPRETKLGSTPLSNLYLASVSIAKSREVFLIEEGKK